jgi:hypothetical protein
MEVFFIGEVAWHGGLTSLVWLLTGWPGVGLTRFSSNGDICLASTLQPLVNAVLFSLYACFTMPSCHDGGWGSFVSAQLLTRLICRICIAGRTVGLIALHVVQQIGRPFT